MYNGATYHVQTEDWGRTNPFIVSLIFSGGAIVKNIRVPYTKVLPQGIYSEDTFIRLALETQHQSVLDLLVSGQLV
ncbi:MAG: hypothetical protein A2Z20_07915 [Bdellovibrionales bacterium RBG_16_40_8]|nr:MAG: hypothetical protein A2Z20_07915 [Bdellovibrionales bacterium RBG_16_40_8]